MATHDSRISLLNGEGAYEVLGRKRLHCCGVGIEAKNYLPPRNDLEELLRNSAFDSGADYSFVMQEWTCCRFFSRCLSSLNGLPSRPF
ncbi:MAG: hypothetical protein ACLSUW_09415 [Akkermansia sp.]